MPVTYAHADRLLDYNFGQTAYSVPATYYFALSTNAIQPDGTGCVEPVGNAYARVAIANNKTNWTVASNGTLTNNIQAQFPESTGSWGTATHVAIFDAATGGNLLFYDALQESRTIESQTTLMFMPNTITVQFT